jgi:hypothetical protein
MILKVQKTGVYVMKAVTTKPEKSRERRNGEEQRNRELELKRLLLELLGTASKDLDAVMGPMVAGNMGKKIIVNGQLPNSILRQLKELGYEIVELETPRREYGLNTGKTGPKQSDGQMRVAHVAVSAREPDPALAVKNAEAARAMAERRAEPKQKHPVQRIPGAGTGKPGDKFLADGSNLLSRLGQSLNGGRAKHDGQNEEKGNGPRGWISDMSISGDSARCTIHYHSEAERSALETQARSEMNSLLNEKSYIRKEANREAYPALTREREGPGRSLGLGLSI